MNLEQELNFREYCCKDAWTTLKCMKGLEEELKEAKLTSFYSNLVQPLIQTLHEINMKGIWVDLSKKDEAISKLDEEASLLEREVWKLAGRSINVRGEEFSHFLYHDLRVPCTARTKKGIGKVNKKILKDIIIGNIAKGNTVAARAAQLCLDFKAKKKIISTFLEGAISGEDGRVHPSYKVGPATGRLACRRPNLQQVPNGPGRLIYAAPPGHKLIYADYSQVELRILAILANDIPLLTAFEKSDQGLGEDVHSCNARDLFSIPLEKKIGERQRFFAKTFIYGLNYGGGLDTIRARGAELLAEVSLEKMQIMADAYFEAHPALLKFRNKIKTSLYQRGILYNAFGRPRLFFAPPKIAVRSAYNFPIQSSAADMVNSKLVKIAQKFPRRIILQVHDAIVLEVPEREVERTVLGFKEILLSPVPELGGYVFPADVKIGDRWSDF